MYVGYPISIETACTIFHISPEAGNAFFLNSFVSNYGLEFRFYDKNVYILGLCVNDFHAGRKPTFVNDSFEIILSYKKRVMDALTKAAADLTEFDIEIMEDEPQRVYNPKPYLIG
jgi:hypothetical protein